jgi:hypothetical protein
LSKSRTYKTIGSLLSDFFKRLNPEVKMSSPEYPRFLPSLKSTIRQRQYQALRAVNHELLAFGWTKAVLQHHSERNPFFDIAICDFKNRARRSPIASLSGYVGQASRLTSNDLRLQARCPSYTAEAMSRVRNPYGDGQDACSHSGDTIQGAIKNSYS